MTSDIIPFKKKEKANSDLLLIENIEKKLLTSKNEIKQLKNHLNCYKDERIEIKNHIEKMNTVLNPLSQEKDLARVNSNSSEKRLQLEQSLNDIYLQMKKFLANERKLKQELKKQEENIEHLIITKNGYLQEIEDYRITIHLYERSTKHLSQALEASKQLVEDTVREAEEKIQDTVNSVENKQLQLLNKIEKQEHSLLKYKQLEVVLHQRLEEKNNYIHSLKQEVNELKNLIEIRNQKISSMEREIQQKSQSLMELKDQKPKQERHEMYTIKKGSWLSMAWHLWSNDSEMRYLEKIEQLNSTIKELQQGLKHYESLLEKMNAHFQRYEEDKKRYEEDKINYINQAKELNDHLQIQKENEMKYLKKIEKLEKELRVIKEQDRNHQKQKEELEKTIKEIKQREEDYKSQLEQMKLKSIEQTQQLKETIQGFQKKEKQYREKNQHTPKSPQNKPERNKQVRATERKQLNSQIKPASVQQQQQSQLRYEKLKQFYPQAQSIRSVFNPFK
ncbi:coiled-coil domain-containing protein [Niallia endozanthoxylica]|uniref:Uncharacterized protein n=1 Tax=Niallia endozanthoxylica TaxID=2036016 RepID=A0A5J5H0Y3_9BACI|nr:hypothetical protein [Niallia endozanthoxylica]KAA9013568.1 hypothetical protein F4V44_24620 [Niallia endozanthoxylica]